jgi:hypothetical protein
MQRSMGHRLARPRAAGARPGAPSVRHHQFGRDRVRCVCLWGSVKRPGGTEVRGKDGVGPGCLMTKAKNEVAGPESILAAWSLS